MDLKLIKELMSALEKSKLQKLSVREKNGFQITIEKESDVRRERSSIYQSTAVEAVVPKVKTTPIPQEKSPTVSKECSVDKSKTVTSPMIGTFYTASGPDAKPFVSRGDRVKKGDVVCIIEAMKVMNEIKSPRAGIIREICINDSEPVEFGQTLFVID